MPKRVTPEEHIEGFFTRESQPKCIAQRERIDLMMRVRFPELQDPKRGRPRKRKGKPPITTEDTGTHDDKIPRATVKAIKDHLKSTEPEPAA